MNGWRDSFNFADLVLREVENAEYIAGHRLVKSKDQIRAFYRGREHLGLLPVLA